MLCLKVRAKQAEKARQELIARTALASGFKAVREKGFVFFPLKKRVKATHGAVVSRAFEKTRKTVKPLKKIVGRKLSSKQKEELVSSFDLVGDIAILEVPEKLAKKEKTIAESLLESNPRIKVVVKKASAMKGEYRVRELTWLAGENRTFTIYKESGCSFYLDLAKTYFSIRLSNERLRITELVKPGEKVLALFAGAGPFPIVLAKKKPVECIAIELNPDACKMMRENVLLNKLGDKIEVIQGDVKKELAKPRFRQWADRTIMPLPHTGDLFLREAIAATKKGGVIHFYGFTSLKGKAPDYAPLLEKVTVACAEEKRGCEVVGKRKVRPYAPFVVQVAIDFRV